MAANVKSFDPPEVYVPAVSPDPVSTVTVGEVIDATTYS
jgi:hypothetical protein